MPEGSGSATTRSADDLGSLVVTLLYERAIQVDHDSVLAAVQEALPGTVMHADERSVVLAHQGHGATVVEGRQVPVLTVVLPVDDYSGVRDKVDLSQTWTFKEAHETLARCRGALIVAEMMGRELPPAERLLVFRETLLAVCHLTQPSAAWWPGATQLLPTPASDDWPLMGFLNVRLFRVEGSDDVVMDTLGLGAFGLPDVQCHCRGLAVTRLAGFLRDAGMYVFEHGDVIQNGHTIEGFEPSQRWVCQHEKALVSPDRIVIDVDPGAPYAAGNRGGQRGRPGPIRLT